MGVAERRRCATEVTGVAYDRITKAIITGQQDNGTSVMNPNVNVNTAFASKVLTNILSADGGKVAADPLIVGGSTVATNVSRYYSSQFLGGGVGGFIRRKYNSTNTSVSIFAPGLTIIGPGVNLFAYESSSYGGSVGSIQFLQPIAINKVVGGRLYIGTRRRSGSWPRPASSRSRGVPCAFSAMSAAVSAAAVFSTISAIRCCSAWNLPIGRPNCTRSLAYWMVMRERLPHAADHLEAAHQRAERVGIDAPACRPPLAGSDDIDVGAVEGIAGIGLVGVGRGAPSRRGLGRNHRQLPVAGDGDVLAPAAERDGADACRAGGYRRRPWRA